MREQSLLQKAKQNPLLDAAARVAAWPVLAAQYRQAQRQADARRAGAHDPQYEWILKQRGRFAGQRCFVVATGPSLTMEDLDRIRGEYSFSMNSCLLAWENTAWRPDVYMLQDRYVYQKLAPLLAGDAGSQLPEIWVSGQIAAAYPVPERFRAFPLHELDHKMFHRKGWGEFRFSEDCYSCVCDGYSVTFSALQMACYMGFREIYLLGCDCNYNQPKSHFLPYGYHDPKAAVMGDKMLQAHAAFRRFAQARGVRVVNCTRGGMLEVYPRVPLEEIV